MNEPRRTALEILKNIIEKKLFFSEAKNAAGISSAEDSAFVNMLVLTTLRHLVFIKKALKKFVKKKLPADVVAGEFALFLGTAEILYLNTPDYAVINSYVDLVKRADNKYIAGFVNAVLRKCWDLAKAAKILTFFYKFHCGFLIMIVVGSHADRPCHIRKSVISSVVNIAETFL